jgi:DNA processing protein
MLGDEFYPRTLLSTLGDDAPPVLFLQGNPRLIHRECIAIVGSRKPCSRSQQAAAHFGEMLARNGRTVISGGARGIDTIGHRNALAAGATAVVPPVGIFGFHWRGIPERALRSDQWAIVGQFPPSASWRNRNALLRNRTIVGTSQAVIGFDPRDRGGTWHSCRTALRLRKPTFVCCSTRPAPRRRGLQKLVRWGAVALNPECLPDFSEFEDMVRSYQPPSPEVQKGLFRSG